MATFAEDAAKPPQHPDEYLRTVYACGQRKDHQVRIHRASWPPKAQPGVTDQPYVAGVCARCGARCIVYDPPSSDMTVVLYGDAADAVGKVVDEKGKVIEEHAVPKGGQVVDTHPPPAHEVDTYPPAPKR